MADDVIYTETTGVYLGILQEDMIDTVKRVKRPYCKVSVPDVFGKSASMCPLAYVPMWNMTLPLKKDDEVLIRFSDNEELYPYVWKPVAELDSAYLDKYNLPNSGSYVQIPSTKETCTVTELNNNGYIIATDSYICINTGSADACYILSRTNGHILYGPTVGLLANQIKIEAKNNGLITIGNALFTLKALVQELILDLKTLKTEGTPFVHTSPTLTAQMEVLGAKFDQLLGE